MGNAARLRSSHHDCRQRACSDIQTRHAGQALANIHTSPRTQWCCVERHHFPISPQSVTISPQWCCIERHHFPTISPSHFPIGTVNRLRYDREAPSSSHKLARCLARPGEKYPCEGTSGKSWSSAFL